MTTAAPAGTGPALYPTPTTGCVTLVGAIPGSEVRVLDALSRVVATATTNAASAAALGTGLAPGVYVRRAGSSAALLVVERVVQFWCGASLTVAG